MWADWKFDPYDPCAWVSVVIIVCFLVPWLISPAIRSIVRACRGEDDE